MFLGNIIFESVFSIISTWHICHVILVIFATLPKRTAALGKM